MKYRKEWVRFFVFARSNRDARENRREEKALLLAVKQGCEQTMKKIRKNAGIGVIKFLFQIVLFVLVDVTLQFPTKHAASQPPESYTLQFCTYSILP